MHIFLKVRNNQVKIIKITLSKHTFCKKDLLTLHKIRNFAHDFNDMRNIKRA